MPNDQTDSQAIPVLRYERQTGTADRVWVVRFVGMWVAYMGMQSVLFVCVNLYPVYVRAGVWAAVRVDAAMALLGGLLFVAVGAAIFCRRRFGFVGGTIAVGVLALAARAHEFFAVHVRIAAVGAVMDLLSYGSVLAVLISVFRWADGNGVIGPVGTSSTTGSDEKAPVRFLVSRMGWLYTARGALVLVEVATRPLRATAGVRFAPWSWYDTFMVTQQAMVGICGVLMCLRWRPAVWMLALILPADGIVVAVPNVWTAVVSGRMPPAQQMVWLATTICTSVLLCILDRKASAEAKRGGAISG